MVFKLIYTNEANQQLDDIENNPSLTHIAKSVSKTLGLMETNLKHPSLNSHKYNDLKGPNKEEVFEVYVQNKTSGAYRIFWYYGPDKSTITIFAVIPNP